MEFDKKTLTPLYRLRTGEPGQSHALEIAKKYGLSERIISVARELLGGGKVELDDLMADLNEKRAAYEALLKDVAERQAEVKAKDEAAREKVLEAEIRKREMLAEAHREALGIVADIKRQMRAELDEIKKKEKKDLQEKIRAVEQKQKEIVDKLAEYDMDEGGALSIRDIDIGDAVFVKSLGYDGTVSGIMEKVGRVKVVSGTKEILVPISDLRTKKGMRPGEKAGKVAQQTVPDEAVPSRINFVGLRVDEALSRLEPFLNHASLAGFQEVTIIHGVGAGILQRAVRAHLEGHPLVKKFRSGDPSEGGAGVTVVTLV
jgi:DNA mismatch repair protein MutS2